ncbi:MAG: nickel/cobalt efflux transporter [Alphaproteobacteria bacterium]|jgi:nickel/cobalt exporter
MPDIASLIQQGAIHLWIFIPTAILLGSLHGLEPGHSKTMMAAFIIAVRGTVKQAVLLGLSATISHTLVVWLVAITGMYFLGGKFDAETTEPYFQIASGVLIIAIALWMLYRILKHHNNYKHKHSHSKHSAIDIVSPEYQDAHAVAHANDIRHHFANRSVTNGQIIAFGLTGGLIPCPASITVLLLCLQLKKIALGGLLVLCFSIGLAITLVASGIIATISTRKMAKKMSKGFGAKFSRIARNAPYFSVGLIVLIGSYVSYHGLRGIVN